MKLSSNLLFIIIQTGLMVVFFLLFFKPAAQEIEVLQGEIFRGQLRSPEEKRITWELNEKTDTVRNLAGEVERLRTCFLPPDEYSTLMEDVRQLISEFGLKKGSGIHFKEKQQRENFNVALFELTLEGGFKETYSFLVGLEDLLYAVQIEKLDMRSGGEDQHIFSKLALSAPLDTL
jgi:hypothetical protein